MIMYEESGMFLLRILTDRVTEYRSVHEHHGYQLYLAIENIDLTKIKARYPQTNGICKRFYRTILKEFYAVAIRKKIYNTLEELSGRMDLLL